MQQVEAGSELDVQTLLKGDQRDGLDFNRATIVLEQM